MSAAAAAVTCLQQRQSVPKLAAAHAGSRGHMQSGLRCRGAPLSSLPRHPSTPECGQTHTKAAESRSVASVSHTKPESCGKGFSRHEGGIEQQVGWGARAWQGAIARGSPGEGEGKEGAIGVSSWRRDCKATCVVGLCAGMGAFHVLWVLHPPQRVNVLARWLQQQQLCGHCACAAHLGGVVLPFGQKLRAPSRSSCLTQSSSRACPDRAKGR